MVKANAGTLADYSNKAVKYYTAVADTVADTVADIKLYQNKNIIIVKMCFTIPLFCVIIYT